MALTNLSQITTSGISTLADINLNNITGVAATFTGNVTVGGTLTYDDVTNIDSVGLVTARSGVNITGGDLTLPDAIIHAGDTNTKIRFPADDTVTVETAGSERLRVTSGGEIVSTNGTLRRNVSDSSFTISGDTASNTGANINLYGASHSSLANIFRVRIGASEKLRITSGGNVGINRTDPDQKLNVSGNIELNAYDNAGGSGGYYTSKGLIIGNLYDAGKSYTGSDDRTACVWQERGLDLDFATNDALRMKITYDGKVGIATVNPSGNLHVGSGSGQAPANSAKNIVIDGSGAVGMGILFGTSANTAYGNIYWGNSTDGSADGRITYFGSTYATAGDRQAMVFRTAGSERLRITSGGNIGIGEDSPDVRLHVKEQFDTSYSLANVADEANHLLKLENPSTTANAFSGMQFRVGSGADLFFGAIQQSVNHGDFFFANQNSPNQEMMRIKSTGRVAIGTPSDIDHTLCVAGTDNTTGLTGGHSQGIQLQNKSTTDGTYSHIEWRTAAGGRYARIAGIQDDANGNGGQLVFLTETSGGTTTERLRIDSSGRVLQGLTSAKFGFFNDGNAPPVFQIQGDTYYDSALSIFRDGTGASGPNFILAKGRGAIVQDNDILGTISFQGHDGTTELIEGASIVTEVDGTPSANNVPSALVFKTNSGTSSTSERLRIDSSGRIAQGGKTPTSHGSPNLLLWGADTTLHLTSTGSVNNSSFTGIKFAVAGGSTGDYSKAGIFVQRQSTYTDLDMIFAFRSTADAAGVAISDEKLRLLSGGGITFNGDTAAANALDDYEEGTFAPTATMSISGSLTLKSSFNDLSYIKIGTLVTIVGQLRIDSVSSPVGNVILTLPFTARSTIELGRAGTAMYYYDASESSGNITKAFPMNVTESTATFYVLIKDTGGGITPGANDELAFSFNYVAA
jgi:hypothetical protein